MIIKNFTLPFLLAISFLIASQEPLTAQRTLRWKINNMATNHYEIRNTNNTNTFLNPSNWRLVDPASGVVTSTTATPSNGDTLQIFDASLILSVNFDMTALQDIILDFGNPRPGFSWCLQVKRDNIWLLHSSAKINVRWGDLISDIDDVPPINTGMKIGGVFKLMSVDYATAVVHGPSHADPTTPITTTILQEGFTLGTLPVVLVSFDAVKQGNGVLISWRTQQEYNTKEFHVEKSADGRNFIPLTTLPAAGNSTVPRSYSYIDQSAQTGISYYRVRIISNDMAIGFTPVKAVRGSALSRLGIYPNPAQNQANLIVNNPDQTPFTVNIFNSYGQLVQQRKISGGTNTVSLDLQSLQAGDYTVDILLTDGSRQMAKLLIKK